MRVPTQFFHWIFKKILLDCGNIAMVKVIIYNRTSTEEQNPENQMADCISINEYGDYLKIQDKQSAWKDHKEREGFEKLKKLIKGGEIKHLIVWDFDRIYRNRIRFKEFLLMLKAYKVRLHSYRQQWFEDLHKIPEPWNEIVYDLMTNIYGHIAEDESKKKSDRVKAAVRRDGSRTKSYKGNIWGRRNIPSNVLKDILGLYEQGKSYRDICHNVYYWDSNKHKKNVSMGLVHKTITKFKREKHRK